MADVRLRLLTSLDGKGVSLSASNLASDVELEIPPKSGKMALIEDIETALEGFEAPVGGGGIGSGPSTTGNGLPPYLLGQEVLTAERWIDGKPIYRKVIDFGALPDTTTKSVLHGIENTDYIQINRRMSYVSVGLSYVYGVEFFHHNINYT